MRCSTVRSALSALADGEPPAASMQHVDRHLLQCAACRGWRQAAGDLSRRSRVGRPLPAGDLTDRIGAAVVVDSARRQSRRQWIAAGLMVALSGCLQVVVTVPLLLIAHHGSRHSGGWLVILELLVGASFFLGAVVLLWHTRQPVEPVVPLASVEPAASSHTNVEGVA